MSSILTKEILLKKIFTDPAGQKHFYHTKEYTSQFDAIEDEAAAILAGAQASILYLNGLKEISAVSAKKIAQAKVGALFLNGLKELSIDSAKELGKVKCDVYLEGLVDISDPCLEFLAKCKAGLSLGLSKLSENAAIILGKRKKGHLYLPCLLEISDQAAKSLSRHQGGNLGLDGLKKLSNGAVKYLCEHQSVSLTSLLEVSDEALGQFLTAHQKGMDLSFDGRTMERIKKIRIARGNQSAIEESEDK